LRWWSASSRQSYYKSRPDRLSYFFAFEAPDHSNQITMSAVWIISGHHLNTNDYTVS
jgi:hypothetical protein